MKFSCEGEGAVKVELEKGKRMTVACVGADACEGESGESPPGPIGAVISD